MSICRKEDMFYLYSWDMMQYNPNSCVSQKGDQETVLLVNFS